MCRLLLVRSDNEFIIKDYLEKFSEISRNSKEFQGHGWGCSYLSDLSDHSELSDKKGNEWKHYKNISPVWVDDLSKFGKTKLLIAHARSAFKDEGIVIENNMPFYDDRYVFVFNGELRGVKINSEGRIGAEKIFNYIKRFDKGNFFDALKKGTDIIDKKTSYIRAMNIIMCSKENVYLYSKFNEDPDYFTMYFKNDKNTLVISSMPLKGIDSMIKIGNNSLTKF